MVCYLLYLSSQLCIQWCHIGSLKLTKLGVFNPQNLQAPHIMSPSPSQLLNFGPSQLLNFCQNSLGPGCTPNMQCGVILSKVLFLLASFMFMYYFTIYKRGASFVCWPLLSHVILRTTREVGRLSWSKGQRMLPLKSWWLWLLGWLSPRLTGGGAVDWLSTNNVEASHISFFCGSFSAFIKWWWWW